LHKTIRRKLPPGHLITKKRNEEMIIVKVTGRADFRPVKEY